MGYTAFSVAAVSTAQTHGYLHVAEEAMSRAEAEARDCDYDIRSRTYVCPPSIVGLPDPPPSTCPGCGAPMKLGAQVCAYCRRPHGS